MGRRTDGRVERFFSNGGWIDGWIVAGERVATEETRVGTSFVRVVRVVRWRDARGRDARATGDGNDRIETRILERRRVGDGDARDERDGDEGGGDCGGCAGVGGGEEGGEGGEPGAGR